MRNYNLNQESAKQADNFGNYLDETGKYKGAFVIAEAVTSKKGTEGIEFVFKADDGREANYLTIWTHDKDGKELSGLKTLNAIMACMRLPKIEVVQASIEKYDSAQGRKVQIMADTFPSLTKRPIGVLLQREAYEKQGGKGIGHKLNIVAAFEPQTELMASELIAKKTVPEQLGKVVARLADKPLKNNSGQAASDAYSSYADNNMPPSDFDDIGF